MRTISNNTLSAAASDSVYNESTTTLFISGLTGAEVAPIQISGDNVNFVNYYEGGSLVQLSAGATSKSVTYPGYYRVSVPNTSAIASVSVLKPEWSNIVDRHIKWAPSKLDSNLLLWLDAIDQSTIIQVSSKVSQWNDLSGNARHVTQSNASLRPVYSSSTYGLCISYANGTSLNIPAGAITALSPETFVIVGLCNFGTSGVNGRYVYYNGFYSGTTGSGQLIAAGTTDAVVMRDSYDGDVNKYIGTSPTMNSSQDSLFAMYHDGTNLVKRMYGAQFDSDVTSGTYNTASGNVNLIGVPPFDGKVYSIIVANYTSALDVQKLEGYICHRYGAQALLASSHPYRNVAP